MVHIELSDAEATTLRQLLETYLSDLRMEIADTDSMDFRETLKGKRDAVQKILDGLGPNSAT